MAKTVTPGKIKIPHIGEFETNAVPDPFDKRDLEYRPRLQLLAPMLDQRSNCRVLHQQGKSCVGHAIAAALNSILAHQIGSDNREAERRAQEGQAIPVAEPVSVSPYMLYRLARRYDEFEGEADIGSSLRGGFKGWFNHGVSLHDDWPKLDMTPEPDLDSEEFRKKCSERPLGAFYRVNPYRLDDMQSAINELQVIVVSAVIHEGWVEPIEMVKDDRLIHMIESKVNAKSLGGHAFALVGYNDVGFLVQNSWGEKWGKGGFATLPYEDWLDSAYDAWVARPGVPRTPFASGRSRTTLVTGGVQATSPAPDLRRLGSYVVNLGNNGQLSTTGKFVSSPAQIEGIFQHMEGWHKLWLNAKKTNKRHIAIYAHGGLVSESSGLTIAEKHLNWWLNNHIFPISFAWQSGPVETLVDNLTDLTRDHMPFGGIGSDLVEQFDRLAEKTARLRVRWMWDQMKQNAGAASLSLTAAQKRKIKWPPKAAATGMAVLPGATLTITRLKKYIDDHEAENVAVHLIGHSAGSIFLASMIEQLVELDVNIESLTFLAPAIRVDKWATQTLPHLKPNHTGTKRIRKFSTFALNNTQELNDTVGLSRFAPYQKSLLYLVSRALEDTSGTQGEIPLLGMQKFFDQHCVPGDSNNTLRQIIEALGDSAIVFSEEEAAADVRSESTSHGDFDDDSATMTSVVMRALGIKDVAEVEPYRAYAPLKAIGNEEPPPAASTPSPVTPPQPPDLPMAANPPEPLEPTVAVNSPGSASVTVNAPPQLELPKAPPVAEGLAPEVAVAPHSESPIKDIMEYQGWTELRP